MKKLTLTFLLAHSIFFYFINQKDNTAFIERNSNTSSHKIDRSAEKMRSFIMKISKYAKEHNPEFYIIPQNGIELCFNELEFSQGTHQKYINSIDGIGIESLFYPTKNANTKEKLKALNSIKDLKQILVSDYTKSLKQISYSNQRNSNEDFISFPRTKNNYDYSIIPTQLNNENNRDIKSLDNAKNFLYLINFSNFKSKKEVLEKLKNTNYDLLLIDLFFNETPFTLNEIKELKIKKNGGKRLLISYINIGAAENFRYYWKPKWKLGSPSWLRKEYEGYHDEFWVQFWKRPWQKIIYGNRESYIKKILDTGFDGAYLDNVECYYFLNFD
ncbi:cysteinyl-tRNA synthetase, unknown class [Tenacibaculum sp. MAR_2009_124]|uniref:endo alpha-1,4 polygalactosaminidase n=1 Tax=Tenacibaculum sp. MAR_2009_124 TaxID=1250059 RepID=UPI000896A9C3|nr:endo alpha-1,4 polygalactosaminidase [Tenacibaculum sp. MAR_2009_124]SED14655.1 cysteinyl-tRNA synthetase, unknown class [Tenacibaculum sp. MAR_2009_124]